MANLGNIAAGTLIGFSGNKTVDTAKADTATNRVDICKTKELYFNGERLGITDAETQFFDNGLNGDGTVKASKVIASNGSNIEKYIEDNVVGAYKFRASVEDISEILAMSCNKGDIFNVTKDFTLLGQSFSAGTNVAVDTTFAAGEGRSSYLDALGGVTINTSHFANIYTYNKSVLPTKDVASTDSGLTTEQINGLKDIVKHLANGDLVMIVDDTPSIVGDYREIINKYQVVIKSDNGLEFTYRVSFGFKDKSYLIDNVDNTWMISIGKSESRRLREVEIQLQLA